MTIEISQIENKALRKAAEKADSQGNLDGKLDEVEMSVFTKAAYGKGCNAKDITGITGAETENETLAKTLEEMQAIEMKKAELEAAERELSGEKESYKNVSKDSRVFGNIVSGVTGVLGGGAGFGALVGIAAVLGKISEFLYTSREEAERASDWIKRDAITKRIKSLDKIDKAFLGTTNFGGIARIVAVVGLCGAGAYLAGKALSEKTDVFGIKPHKAKVSQKNAEEYTKTNVEPAKAKVEQLKQEVQEMQNAFVMV